MLRRHDDSAQFPVDCRGCGRCLLADRQAVPVSDARPSVPVAGQATGLLRADAPKPPPRSPANVLPRPSRTGIRPGHVSPSPDVPLVMGPIHHRCTIYYRGSSTFISVSILETVAIFAGIPLGIYLIIAGLSYLGKPLPGEKPVHFDMSQKWTSAPVLWSATDEITGHGHSYDAGESSHGSHVAFDALESPKEALIGGRASGKY